MNITADDIENAIATASRKRKKRKDVRFVWVNLPDCVRRIYEVLEDGSWPTYVKYRPLVITNNNGKVRFILSPNFFALILQHLAVNKLMPLYYAKDNNVACNCKPAHGITATQKKNSVVKRLKHIYYDERKLEWCVVVDTRKCYEHITRKQLRKALKLLTQDKWLIDFAVDVSFVKNTFPIGTPSSPPMHHIIMLLFDNWAYRACPLAVRYADDVFLPFPTKEEAQQMLWRVKQFWWYTYQLRAKSTTQKVISLAEAIDFCGYIIHRNENKKVSDHNKGYTGIRNSTYVKAMRCTTNESYASYYGIMLHADMFNVMRSIEKANMNLRELTRKIKIDRKLDAENIEMKELATSGIEFTIYDYDLRRDAKGVPNWIKCLIGIPEVIDGVATGKILAREFHGSADGIVRWHVACEQEYGKDALLPMTEMRMQQKCGYIYEGSTNMQNEIKL